MPNHNPNSMNLHTLHYDHLGRGVIMHYIQAYHSYYDVEEADVMPLHIPVERDGVVVGNRPR